MTEPRRRRGGRRTSEAPELDECALVAELRRRSWAWFCSVRPRTVVEPAPLVEHALPANDAAPSPEAAPKPKRKRAPRSRAAEAPADGVTALRRKAWWWLKPRTAAPAAEAEPPRRKKGKREAALPDGVAELRRRAWAWFAPKTRAEEARVELPGGEVVRAHLKGVLEALIFASEHPLPAKELARIAQADLKLVRALLAELTAEYHSRGVRLDEIAGGFVFRTSPVFAPFVREQVAKKPVKMSRAQIETLAIVAYRQPITRPEIDEVRGVDSGAVLKSLLERELVRILGKKDEPGRPMLYGTTGAFLEFFGLKALGDLPTLKEFTELTDESKRAYEREMGEEPGEVGEVGLMGGEGEMRREVDVRALEEDPTAPAEPGAGPEPKAEDAHASEDAQAHEHEHEDEGEEDEDEDEEDDEEDEDDEDEDEDGEDDEDEDEDEDEEDEDEDDEDEDDEEDEG